MEIVAVTFKNAQKHINALRGQKFVLIRVKTSRMYTDCQVRQRKLFFIKIMLSKMNWLVKLSLNSSIKSFSCYFLITPIRPEGQDSFSRRFAYVQTSEMLHTLNFFILPRVSSLNLSPLNATYVTFFSIPTIKFVVKINKTENHQLQQSMAT